MTNPDLIFVPKVDSTNATLAEYLQQNPNLTEGSAVYSGYQEKGRGQQNNFWESAANQNLLCSMVLFPHFIKAEHQFLLSKAVSLGICQALNEFHKGIQLKWPNDIYVGDKKLGGILIETALVGAQFAHAIVGFGINLNQEKFYQAPNAVSLKSITNINYKPLDVLKRIQESILKQYQLLHNENARAQLEIDYFNQLIWRNEIRHYKDDNGKFRAVLLKVEPNGQLVLFDENRQTRKYWMKEVSFCFD